MLKELKKEKGILSRKIGELKKAGQPVNHVIEQLKQITSQIKEIERKEKADRAAQCPPKEDSSIHTVLPPQFCPLIESTASEGEVTVSVCDDVNLWNDYVDQHPNATIYHRWEIKRVIEQSFQHSCHYFVALDKNRHVRGILPLIELNSRLFGHFMVSVPFFNYGGLLSSNRKAEKALQTAAITLAQKIKAEHIEYRDCHPSNLYPSKSNKVSMLLALPANIEQLWSQLGSKLRAQVKKSQRNFLTCRIGKEDLLKDFYSVFSQNMRDLGTPVYSQQFFSSMLVNCQTARIIIVYHQQKPVSCGFLLGWKHALEIPWASTLKSANRYDANMFMYWEILKYAIQERFQVFDFGRSSRDAGTYKFKKQWGAKEHQLYWHYWLPEGQTMPEINPGNPKFRIFIAIWKRLPIWVTRIAGPSIVKNLP